LSSSSIRVHRASYDPYLTAWRKKLPADVEYKRIPIAWDNSTLPHVRIYYALEALGKLDEMHQKVFAAIQKNKQPLLNPEQIADFMAANGIDRKQWITPTTRSPSRPAPTVRVRSGAPTTSTARR
jgi:thiol:disulfide interchange protein DsbA